MGQLDHQMTKKLVLEHNLESGEETNCGLNQALGGFDSKVDDQNGLHDLNDLENA